MPRAIGEANSSSRRAIRWTTVWVNSCMQMSPDRAAGWGRVGESDHLLAGKEGTDLSCYGPVLHSYGEWFERLVVEYLRPQEIAEELHRISHVMKGADLFEAALSGFESKIAFGVRDSIAYRGNEFEIARFQHAAPALQTRQPHHLRCRIPAGLVRNTRPSPKLAEQLTSCA